MLAVIREAIKAGRAVQFRYEGGSTPGRAREVTPFGILFGRSNYMVAAETQAGGPRNWRLDRMGDVAVSARVASRPEDFSLQDYADQSFGIYHDEIEDVILRISPAGVEDALRWRFHVNQTVELLDDGGARVRFRASGMLELAWHLFSWSGKAVVEAPEILRETLAEQIALASAAVAKS